MAYEEDLQEPSEALFFAEVVVDIYVYDIVESGRQYSGRRYCPRLAHDFSILVIAGNAWLS